MPSSVTEAVTTQAVTYAAGAAKGVAMVTPPADLLPSITAAITKACASIPDGRTAALVAVVDVHGANLAYCQKVGGHVNVMAWAGRKWGEPLEGGVSVMASW